MSYPTMLTWQPSFLEGGGGHLDVGSWASSCQEKVSLVLGNTSFLTYLTTFLMLFRAERSSYIENIIQY